MNPNECHEFFDDESFESFALDSEFLEDFVLETREHLESIEMNVLNLETDRGNQEIIHSLFRSFHTIKGLAGFVEQDMIQKLAHCTENLLDECRKGIAQVNKTVVNLILDSADLIQEVCTEITIAQQAEFIERVEEHLQIIDNKEYLKSECPLIEFSSELINAKRVGEILVEDCKLKPEDLDEILQKQSQDTNLKFGEIAIQEKKVKAKDVLESIRKQKSRPQVDEGGHIRIPIQKVDNLVDLMGELIITQSQLEQDVIDRFGANDSFLTKLMNMSRIMKEMQNVSMSLRMVSLRSTFQKIQRIARDTIDELQKSVDLILIGEDTEIDRNIAEKLLDPLVHIVKNAIYHGIEDEDVRVARNKSARGKLEVRAYSAKGSVYIEIHDDGNGIDLERVYQKAIQKNLLSDVKKITDKELLDLIFIPGFSTAQSVDQISGRGVGMDVVKTQVSRIGGKIEIINRPTQGCTFVLKIPINLAVMNGTIIMINNQKYIIPTLNIRQILQPKSEQWVEMQGKRSMIKLRESVIQLLNIAKLFGEEDDVRERDLIIILELDGKMRAIPIDDIFGQREIVVKPLGEEFSDLSYVAGASILGDGTVSLILDIECLFKFI